MVCVDLHIKRFQSFSINIKVKQFSSFSCGLLKPNIYAVSDTRIAHNPRAISQCDSWAVHYSRPTDLNNPAHALVSLPNYSSNSFTFWQKRS